MRSRRLSILPVTLAVFANIVLMLWIYWRAKHEKWLEVEISLCALIASLFIMQFYATLRARRWRRSGRCFNCGQALNNEAASCTACGTTLRKPPRGNPHHGLPDAALLEKPGHSK